MLEAAKNLRLEKEREKELTSQEEQQRSQLLLNDQRLRRLQLQLKELRQSAIGASPEGLLRRLEEECSVNNYIAKQKLPQEIQARQMEVKILENVVNESSVSRSDIEDLNNQVCIPFFSSADLK